MIKLITKYTAIQFRTLGENGLSFDMINDLCETYTMHGTGESAENRVFGQDFKFRLITWDTSHRGWYELINEHVEASVDEMEYLIKRIKQICKGISLKFEVCTYNSEREELQIDNYDVDEDGTLINKRSEDDAYTKMKKLGDKYEKVCKKELFWS